MTVAEIARWPGERMTMTWMNDFTRNDFKTFRETFSTLLGGDYRIWPTWQKDHLDYLFTLTLEAVTRANCGVQERLQTAWGNPEATFALYLRSFAHESLASGSPSGEMLSIDLSGMSTPLVVSSQLGGDATVVLVYNPEGLAIASLAVPADPNLLGIAVDDTWVETVRQLIERADIVVLAASVMTGGVETERALLRESLAQKRTVVLLSRPPDDLTSAFHGAKHQAPVATSAQFPDFPQVIGGWNANDASARADLARAIRTVRDSRRRAWAIDPPKLPPIEVDESLKTQAQHEIALGIREANADQIKEAILHFTAAVYLGYEACSIPAMLDACAQLARWSATQGPLVNDYRRLHRSFDAGVQHGFRAP